MRLLNTTTLELHEFFASNVPAYGILSHRWEEGEVLYKDVRKSQRPELSGWLKVERCCALAKNTFGREWVWIDTCCIDKRSSSELSEAINSMFRWYAEAQECYAYLNDVGGSDTTELMDSFYASRWFTRGWTLQELLAPKQVYFVERDWETILGSRNILPTRFSESPIILRDHISNITGIDPETLDQPFIGKGYDLPDGRFKPPPSRAQMMFWASGRECTRDEDTSYCLLGLFGVNMPLLYGEGGKKAFLRLEQEILKNPDEGARLFLARAPKLTSRGPRKSKL